MTVYKEFQNYIPNKGLALSLGMFDGVHKGHQSILAKLCEVAKEKNYDTALLTFWPHPRILLQPDCGLKLLNTLDEKTALLQQYGIQHLFLKTFDEAFRNLTGEEFIRKILVDTLDIKFLIIGYDHVFGKDKSGNFQLLQKLAPELGFEVLRMDAIDFNNQHISSTKIRQALQNGDIPLANEMLGYHYPLSGTVIEGKKIGRTLGFPTANIKIDQLKFLPKKGAYITEVLIEGEKHQGMLSIGDNPTIEGAAFSVEVYILDFDKNLYGKIIEVRFLAFLHEEIKFGSLEELTLRLKKDKELTERFFQYKKF